jgi:hypothetical protein
VIFGRLLLLILLVGAVGGCTRAEDAVLLPAGHPAEPAARPGLVLADSETLNPELATVKPSIGAASGGQQPSQPAAPHQH